MLNRSHLARYGLSLPVPDYVASEDHLAYRNGGLVTAAREFVPNQKVQHSSDVPLMCLQELLVAHTGVPGRDDHVVHEGVRTVTHRLKQVLQHPLKSRIAVGNAHGHHLPLERSKWGAHGCAGTGLLGERHLMITMFQVNHREDPPPVLLLQHVLNEGQRIAVVLRLGVQAAVVDHEPPFTGHLLGDDEARRGPFGVARLEPASLDEVTEDLLHGLGSRDTAARNYSEGH